MYKPILKMLGLGLVYALLSNPAYARAERDSTQTTKDILLSKGVGAAVYKEDTNTHELSILSSQDIIMSFVDHKSDSFIPRDLYLDGILIEILGEEIKIFLGPEIRHNKKLTDLYQEVLESRKGANPKESIKSLTNYVEECLEKFLNNSKTRIKT